MAALIAGAGVILVLPPSGGSRKRWTVGLLVLRSAFVVVSGFRFCVIASTIGLRVPLIVALAFALASSIGSAVSVFPDSLGVRELVAGGLAPLVGVEASVGITVTALDRVSRRSRSSARCRASWPSGRGGSLVGPSPTSPRTVTSARSRTPETWMNPPGLGTMAEPRGWDRGSSRGPAASVLSDARHDPAPCRAFRGVSGRTGDRHDD